MEAQSIMEVGILTKEEAWTLFRQKAGNSVDDPSLHQIAKEVAEECEGLPLAVITVAGALKCSSKESWLNALNELKRAAPSNIQGVEPNVYGPLKLSFDHLGSNEVKYLFLLCSLFKEDSDIVTQELLRYGMGLGIFAGTANLEEARNRLCHLIETLKDRFLLSEGFKKGCVKMHDVIRDMAIHIASEGGHDFQVSHKGSQHTAIVAVKPDKHNKFVMLEDIEDEGLLTDAFFDETSTLSVLVLKGKWGSSIQQIPTSVQLSTNLNLRTLHLHRLYLDDISNIGKLKSLEILSITHSHLNGLPAEIGNLTNLVILDLHAFFKSEMISPGVLSKLVRLEELNMFITVGEFGFSILSELKSLSKLTRLSFGKCSTNVIHQNLGLPKLTHYSLVVGDNEYKPEWIYDKYVYLKDSDTAQLGEWIINMLRDSECVESTGEVSRSVLVELQRDGFRNVKHLKFSDCPISDLTGLFKMDGHINIPFPKLERLAVESFVCLKSLIYLPLTDDEEEGITQEAQVIKFPNLCKIELRKVANFTHFCNNRVARIEFPQLRSMKLEELPLFENLWPTAKLHSNPLFNEKVSCPSLVKLKLNATNITALCSHQLPTDHFSKLEILKVEDCAKLRNLMSLSAARGFLLLRELRISNCPEMEEVITKEGEVMTNELGLNMFPKLEILEVYGCEKLRNLMPPSAARGFLHLRKLTIERCPEMKEVITKDEEGEVMTNNSLFPRMEELTLRELPKLGHFFLIRHALEFPIRRVIIEDCPEMRTFSLGSVSTLSLESLKVKKIKNDVATDDLIKVMQQLFKETSFLNLKSIEISSNYCIACICSHQHPTGHFSKLEILEVEDCGKLRNLMSLSAARGFLHLRELTIKSCPEMEEVITKEGEVMTNELGLNIFPKLEILEVYGCEKLRNLMPPSAARGFLHLRMLRIWNCPEMEEVITKDEEGEVFTNKSLFPRLETLELYRLPKLGHFFLTKSALQFPILREVTIENCSEMRTFSLGSVIIPSLKRLKVKKIKDDVATNDLIKVMQQLFKEASFPKLEDTRISYCENITCICSHQLPTGCFSKLETLQVISCDKLRNLMSSSAARGFLHLRELRIWNCPEMEEMITKDEEMTDKPLFPRLEELDLRWLPKLGHFFLTKSALQFPILRQVIIEDCHEMKTFILGSVSTPSLKQLYVERPHEVSDLNKTIQHIFNSKGRTY